MNNDQPKLVFFHFRVLCPATQTWKEKNRKVPFGPRGGVTVCVKPVEMVFDGVKMCRYQAAAAICSPYDHYWKQKGRWVSSAQVSKSGVSSCRDSEMSPKDLAIETAIYAWRNEIQLRAHKHKNDEFNLWNKMLKSGLILKTKMKGTARYKVVAAVGGWPWPAEMANKPVRTSSQLEETMLPGTEGWTKPYHDATNDVPLLPVEQASLAPKACPETTGGTNGL